MYSEQQAIEFEIHASPHAWFLVACELHEQAVHLQGFPSSNISLSRISKLNNSSEEVLNWDSSNRTVILLAGFALENILKAFLIYEEPRMIGNGFLDVKLKTHKLTKLAEFSTLVPYKERAMKTLRYFEDGLESWARYPCGINWAQTKAQNLLDERMWRNYRWLMRAYEKRFKALLSQRWKGPHEFEGYYQINGQWLD